MNYYSQWDDVDESLDDEREVFYVEEYESRDDDDEEEQDEPECDWCRDRGCSRCRE